MNRPTNKSPRVIRPNRTPPRQPRVGKIRELEMKKSKLSNVNEIVQDASVSCFNGTIDSLSNRTGWIDPLGSKSVNLIAQRAMERRTAQNISINSPKPVQNTISKAEGISTNIQRSPSDLNAISARATARKVKQQNITQDLVESEGGKETLASIELYAPPAEIDAIAARAAARKMEKHLQQFQQQEQEVMVDEVETFVQYVPPAELDAISARAAARKLQKHLQQFQLQEAQYLEENDDKHESVIHYVPPAELNAIAARAAARKLEKQNQQLRELEEEVDEIETPEPMIHYVPPAELNAIAARAAARKLEKQNQQLRELVEEVDEIETPEPMIHYVPPAELNAIAARAAARKLEKQNQQHQDDTFQSIAEPDEADVRLIALRAQERRRSQWQDTAVHPEPMMEQSFVSPADLNAIAARAATRKIEKQQNHHSRQVEEGAEFEEFDLDTEDQASEFYVPPAELNAIAARAAARKLEKQNQQLRELEEVDEIGTPEPMIHYVPPAELNAIAARAAARKLEKLRSLEEEDKCNTDRKESHLFNSLLDSEILMVSQRAAERRAQQQAQLPSLDEDEPVTLDSSYNQFDLSEHYVPPVELNAIAARAAARKLEKLRNIEEDDEEKKLLEDELSNANFYVSPAELNAIAYRAALRKMSKQQPQVGGEVVRALDAEEVAQVETDVQLISRRAQERRERQFDELKCGNEEAKSPPVSVELSASPNQLGAMAERAIARHTRLQNDFVFLKPGMSIDDPRFRAVTESITDLSQLPTQSSSSDLSLPSSARSTCSEVVRVAQRAASRRRDKLDALNAYHTNSDDLYNFDSPEVYASTMHPPTANLSAQSSALSPNSSVLVPRLDLNNGFTVASASSRSTGPATPATPVRAVMLRAAERRSKMKEKLDYEKSMLHERQGEQPIDSARPGTAVRVVAERAAERRSKQRRDPHTTISSEPQLDSDTLEVLCAKISPRTPPPKILDDVNNPPDTSPLSLPPDSLDGLFYDMASLGSSRIGAGDDSHRNNASPFYMDDISGGVVGLSCSAAALDDSIHRNQAEHSNKYILPNRDVDSASLLSATALMLQDMGGQECHLLPSQSNQLADAIVSGDAQTEGVEVDDWLNDELFGSGVYSSYLPSTLQKSVPSPVKSSHQPLPREAEFNTEINDDFKAAQTRIAEEARVAEELRIAEEARVTEELRIAEETRVAEELRIAEETRVAEELRIAEEARVAEELRIAEETRVAQELRIAEEARIAEEIRITEEARVAEEFRIADESAVTDHELVIEELNPSCEVGCSREDEVQVTAKQRSVQFDPRAGPLELDGLMREVASICRGWDHNAMKDVAHLHQLSRQWCAVTEPARRHVLPHPAGVNAMCQFGRQGRLLTGCNDKTIRLWDCAKLGSDIEPLVEMRGHTNSIECLMELPRDMNSAVHETYGGSLVSGGSEGYLRLWDVEVGVCVRGFEAHVDPENVATTGGVKSVAHFGDGVVITGGRNGGVAIWDPRANEPRIDQWEAHNRKMVSCCAALPGGRYFVTGGWDGRIREWDMRKAGEDRLTETMVADKHRVGACAVLTLSSATELVTGGREGVIRTWRKNESKSWQTVQSIRCHGSGVLSMDIASVTDTSATLITGGARSGNIKFINVGQLPRAVPVRKRRFLAPPSEDKNRQGFENIMGSISYDSIAPRDPGVWKPAWCDAPKGPANVCSLVRLGDVGSAHPGRIAAAVRSDVCIWDLE